MIARIAKKILPSLLIIEQVGSSIILHRVAALIAEDVASCCLIAVLITEDVIIGGILIAVLVAEDVGRLVGLIVALEDVGTCGLAGLVAGLLAVVQHLGAIVIEY